MMMTTTTTTENATDRPSGPRDDTVTRLVEEIRRLRARLESLETVLEHAVIPAVSNASPRVSAPPTDPPSDPRPRARLHRRPVVFPLPDAGTAGPRPPPAT